MKTLKGMAEAVAVIFFTLLTAYLAFTHTQNWQTIVTVAIVLFVMIQLFYKPFHVIKLGDQYSLEFDGGTERTKAETETPSIDPNDFDKLQKRTEKLEKDVHDLKEKLDASNKEDFHKELEQFRLSKPDLDVIIVEGYESPSRLTEFVNLVKKAKTNGYDLSSDSAYQELVKGYRQHIAEQLKTVLETLDYSSEFSERVQKLLEDAMLSVPTNQEVIANIKEELVSANENSKLEISDVFFKATNDLKKLEL